MDQKNAELKKLESIYLGATPELAIISRESADHSPIDIRSISVDRIGIDANIALSLDSEVTLEFRLPRTPRKVTGKVVVDQLKQSGRLMPYAIEGHFTQLSDEDKDIIRQCIEWYSIERLFRLAIDNNASDLHLIADAKPVLRVGGELRDSDFERLSEDDLKIFLYSALSSTQIKKFEDDKELDFAMQFDDNSRFRINMYQQRNLIQAAIRLIKRTHLDFDNLHIPPVVKSLAELRDGLILIVGPANSGKTTTIASMVDYINHNRKAVIITLERPVEYVHANRKSVVSQREVGTDTQSFSSALKASLRQDPNVLVVGELDDVETVKTALVAAQAGYLVIASFHGPTPVQALERLSGMFTGEGRSQILSQLSVCLEGVIAQLLLPRRDKAGRVLASEVLIADDAVRKLIRADQMYQLETSIQTGSKKGMQRMRASIDHLIHDGIIDEKIADFYTEASMKGRRE